MSSIHIFNMDQLKSDIRSILQKQDNHSQLKTILDEKLNTLKECYNQLVQNNTKKIFLFCLDSFYFQYKTLLTEIDNIKRSRTMLNSRIYGDYYKLYHIILTQTCDYYSPMKQLLSEFKKYEPYRDLEPFHEYNNNSIEELHDDILKAINLLYIRFLSKESDILQYTDNTTRGMSIGNFMETLNYENTLFREQITLYVHYLSFFHSTHNDYLAKLEKRMEYFLHEVDEDILNQNNEVMSGTKPPNELMIDQNLINQRNARKTEIQTLMNEITRDLDCDMIPPPNTITMHEIHNNKSVKLHIEMPDKNDSDYEEEVIEIEIQQEELRKIEIQKEELRKIEIQKEELKKAEAKKEEPKK